jgi:oligopeptide transport system substrate-binding protein
MTIVPKVRTTWVGFNFQSGPFAGEAGKLGRQAFSMAIDRKQMADVACSKGVTCSPATGGLITKGLKGYLGDNADPNAVFDAAKAKTLYKQWDPTGSKVKGLKYSFNSSEANQAVGENLQSQWQQNLGVKVDLESLERKTFFDRRDKSHAFALFRGSWQADYDHPQDWFDNLFITALIGKGNAAAYSNKTFDQKVADADTKKVEDAVSGYKDAGKILVDDVAYAGLFYSQGQFLIKPYVSGAGSNNFFDYYWNEIKILKH